MIDYVPGKTVEEVEDEIVNAATLEAYRRLKNGTASSQIVAQYSKPGMKTERLKQEKLEAEIDLLKAKKKQIADQETGEKLLKEAYKAFRGYIPSDTEYEDL